MLCIDVSDKLSPFLAQVASENGFSLQVSRSEHDGMAFLQGSQPCSLLVVFSDIYLGDSLDLIRAAKQLNHRRTLPIAFVVPERDHTLAQSALEAGATEVFLHGDNEPLVSMLMEYAMPQQSHGLSGRALLVEDSADFAYYIETLCRMAGLEIDTCATVDDGIDFLRRQDYQLAIIDVVLQGMQSGLTLVKHIRKLESPKSGLPVLVMSGFDDQARRLEALRCGADDFISKPFFDEEFVWRLRRVMQTGAVESAPPLMPADLNSAHEDWRRRGLSQREAEVCEALILGKSDKQIANDLRISFWTVRTHVSSVFAKLELINRRELLTRYLPGRTQ